MKIPRPLPQFSDARALVVVSSTHSGTIYRVYKGALTEIATIEVPLRSFGDKEGLFVRTSRGGTITKSGAVYEKNHEAERIRYYKRLDETLAHILRGNGNVTELYLFAPAAVMTALRTHLRAPVRALIRRSIRGNYAKLPVTSALRVLIR